ncbi:MAG: methylated-DNA--[protein]-cysteine S-methyltransferase [Eubacterium sp.]|nr:methylated-DNA--[protein]-cysteine S-methyltransferase [Eubacterium sp.]
MDLTDSLIEEISKKYHASLESLWKAHPDYKVVRDSYSGKWFALFMKVKAEHLGLRDSDTGGIEDDIPVVNVKSDPDFIGMVIQAEGFFPAYHMNKRHWVTIRLDGPVPERQILDMIDRSWHLICNTPTRRIYEAVKKVPKGRVATYSRIAELAGNPRMCRAVGNALHKNPDPEHIPCYRIVNSEGKLSGRFAFGGEEVQKKLLEADGIEVGDDYRVDLAKYGF